MGEGGLTSDWPNTSMFQSAVSHPGARQAQKKGGVSPAQFLFTVSVACFSQ